MKCNTLKCKELIIRNKCNETTYPTIMNIEQKNKLTILGGTIQSNCKFSEHIKNKLSQANKCLYVIRGLRKEGYNQKEIDLLFKSLVLSKLTYGLSVYG